MTREPKGLMVISVCVALVMLLVAGWVAAATVPDDVSFPAAMRSGGMPLYSALQRRQSVTSFDRRLLHWETVGNLLWAAMGMNRPDTGGRTVPRILPVEDVKIFLLAAEGIWGYDAQSHRLTGLDGRDLRASALRIEDSTPAERGESRYIVVGGAESEGVLPPIVLLFVGSSAFSPASIGSFGGSGGAMALAQADQHLQQALQVGHIAQNIQLFAISESLGVQTQAHPDRDALAKALRIPNASRILMAQGIGYPARGL